MFKTATRLAFAYAACTVLLAFALLATASGAFGASKVARPVTLTDPSGATFLARMRPGMALSVDVQCPRGRYWSDVSAYRHDGSALHGQRWTVDGTLTYWRGRHGRVTFDGYSFHNGTRATVLVAGWCE